MGQGEKYGTELPHKLVRPSLPIRIDPKVCNNVDLVRLLQCVLCCFPLSWGSVPVVSFGRERNQSTEQGAAWLEVIEAAQNLEIRPMHTYIVGEDGGGAT